MSQPQWVTAAGSLGTIRERVAFSQQLVTTNADITQTVKYQLQSGVLPNGLIISSSGLISGTPKPVVSIATSTFTVRAYTSDAFNDRTFSITVCANPIQWTTPVGNLGTLPEGIFYSVQLESQIITTVSQPIKYALISGLLPAGVYIDDAGLIAGVPRAVVDVAGVPTEVSRDVTSKFAIRAYTEKVISGRTVIDAVNDRTFTFTVSGAGVPRWITPPGVIAEYYVGTQVSNLSVQYTDNNTSDDVTVYLFSGVFPPGVTMNNKGVFSGYMGLNPTPTSNYTYQFVLAVTNGYSTDLRTFDITSLSSGIFTADTTIITADTTYFTADVSSIITPFILTPVGSIGTVHSDNFFAFQFQAIDVYGNQIGWLATTALPPGLTLDFDTGWLYGYIPNGGLTDVTYNFTIKIVEIADPTIISTPYTYSLTVQGSIATGISWLSPSDLGSIDNGSTSTFFVKAVDIYNIPLLYNIKPGSISSLPPGLSLLTSGDIIGQVSFETFTLDHGTTTFDVVNSNPYYNVNGVPTRDSTETTFDLTYTFTVEAHSSDYAIDVFKTFTILVNRTYNEPYENLYIQAMPPFDSRALVNQLITDTSIFSPDLIYRPQDPNFGVATIVTYWHAYGLTAATYEKYVSALALNHYWKNLTMGSIKTARAVDPTSGLTVYEVVYCDIVDNLINNGVSANKEVTLAYPVNPNTQDEIDNVYPNALTDMRQQVIDVVGQISNILPLWMQSVQVDGNILGFTPAWVIAYCNPGTAGDVAYRIATQYGNKLNQFDFEVDRYELDRALTYNWKSAASYNITNIVGDGSNATVSFNPTYPIPFKPTEAVNIADVIPAGYNGNAIVSSATSANAIVPSTESGVFISGGTISNFGNWAIILGSIAIVSADPQTELNTAFPSATSGDGVIDTTTSHIWVFGPSIWIDTNATTSNQYLVFPKKNILE